uniref:Endonuclease/exonuclease/phosphatase domain-containing protein n=1 Tax=Chenopodium quinoa TaxID=63459 RepID=A0A803MYR8_CHEQI
MANLNKNLPLTNTVNEEDVITEASKAEQTEEVIEWDDNGEDDENARIELALVGRIWTIRNVNVNAFIVTMKEVWQPKYGNVGDMNISLHQNNEIFLFSRGESTKNLVTSNLEVSKGSSGKNSSGKVWKRAPRDSDNSMEGEMKLSGEKRKGCVAAGSSDNLSAPQLVFLSETRLKRHEFEKVKNKLNINAALIVECEGWRFTGVYGFPEEENKHKTGILMKNLMDTSGEPWLCGGDFNLMLLSSEKQGGCVFCNEEAEVLREAVHFCQFIDMVYIGHDFMWTNNRGGIENVQERLDRYFANQAWKDCFPGSFVTYLSKRWSDHLPILLCIKEAINTPKKKEEES